MATSSRFIPHCVLYQNCIFPFWTQYIIVERRFLILLSYCLHSLIIPLALRRAFLSFPHAFIISLSTSMLHQYFLLQTTYRTALSSYTTNFTQEEFHPMKLSSVFYVESVLFGIVNWPVLFSFHHTKIPERCEIPRSGCIIRTWFSLKCNDHYQLFTIFKEDFFSTWLPVNVVLRWKVFEMQRRVSSQKIVTFQQSAKQCVCRVCSLQ